MQFYATPGRWIAAYCPEADGKGHYWEGVKETGYGGTNILCFVPVAS